MRKDLDVLRSSYLPELSKTIEIPNRDYPYRAYCSKEQWASALVGMTLDLDYSNFKSEVSARQGSERYDLYHDVWAVMYGAEGKLEEKRKSNVKWDKKANSNWFSKQESLDYGSARSGNTLYPKDNEDPFEIPGTIDVEYADKLQREFDALDSQFKDATSSAFDEAWRASMPPLPAKDNGRPSRKRRKDKKS